MPAELTEPDNLTGWVDSAGDVWVRIDDCRGAFGVWWPHLVGNGWDPRARGDVGGSRPWGWLDAHGPFTRATEDQTAAAIVAVRKERAR